MPHTSSLSISPSKIKPYPRHPYAFAQFAEEDRSECEFEKRRRVVSLFVPDNGPNYFTLPGGIKPGSRFKLDLETKRILTER